MPRNHPTCRPILAALPARIGPSDKGIGPVERPARGQDRGKEQSDEAGTPLDEIGPGGKREARGDPPLAARRSPNRRPPSETPVRAWPARPQLTPFASPDRDADGPAAPARPTTGGPAAPRRAGPPDFPRDAGPTGRRPDSPPLPPHKPSRSVNAANLSPAAGQSGARDRRLSGARFKSLPAFDRSPRSQQIVPHRQSAFRGGGSADVIE